LKAIEQPELELGSDVRVRPPARVLADIAHTRVPVLWMGDNVEQLFAAQPTATRSDGSRPRHPGRAARRLRRSAPTAAAPALRGDEPGRVEATVADDDARPRHPPGREQLSSPR